MGLEVTTQETIVMLKNHEVLKEMRKWFLDLKVPWYIDFWSPNREKEYDEEEMSYTCNWDGKVHLTQGKFTKEPNVQRFEELIYYAEHVSGDQTVFFQVSISDNDTFLLFKLMWQ